MIITQVEGDRFVPITQERNGYDITSIFYPEIYLPDIELKAKCRYSALLYITRSKIKKVTIHFLYYSNSFLLRPRDERSYFCLTHIPFVARN